MAGIARRGLQSDAGCLGRVEATQWYSVVSPYDTSVSLAAG